MKFLYLGAMKNIILCCLFLISLSFGNNGFEELYMISKGSEIIQNINKKIEYTDAFEISTIVYQESEKYDIDFHFTLGIISAESRFNVYAKSYCGAIGLMQLMPKTAKSIAKKYEIDYIDLYDIESNIEIGVAYLAHLKRKYGSYELTAAGYNGGNGGANRYKKYLMGDLSQDSIPSQTRTYVPKVMNYVYEFRRYTDV